MYIGESENVHERLVQHLRDFNIYNEKYEWNTAVIFLGRDLNRSLLRYLQNSLVQQARECNRYAVLTKNTYLNTLKKEWQIVAMDEFIDNVKILINALGYKVLEPIEDGKYEEVDKNEESKSEDENFGYNWIRAKMLLDTIPGWQMYIDAMLSEGSLSKAEAESCREEISRLKKMISIETV